MRIMKNWRKNWKTRFVGVSEKNITRLCRINTGKLQAESGGAGSIIDILIRDVSFNPRPFLARFLWQRSAVNIIRGIDVN